MKSDSSFQVRPANRRKFLQQVTTATLGSLALPGFPGIAAANQAVPSPKWRMRLAFSTVMFAKLPIEEVCERVAGLGFEAIDLWCPFDDCRHLVDVMNRLGPEALQQLLAKHELELGSFTTYETKWDQGGFPAYADFIGKFGGGVVVRQSKYGKFDPGELTSAMRAFFDALKPQIELAGQVKARLAIENHGNALLNSLDSFKAFVDLNPAPERVGLAIAPYHLQRIEAPVEEAIGIAGSQLLFFYAWQLGKALEQLPGHGPADFVPWLMALARINYQGFVNPFLHGHPAPDELSTAIRKSLGYLHDCAAKVAG